MRMSGLSKSYVSDPERHRATNPPSSYLWLGALAVLGGACWYLSARKSTPPVSPASPP